MIVIDASLAIDLSLLSQDGASLWSRVEAQGAVMAAPELIDLEILQTLRRLRHQGHITEDRALAAFRLFDALPIERHSHHGLTPRIWALKDNLTAYDASYFALAEILEAPLWTRDKKFLSVPGHHAVITVL